MSILICFMLTITVHLASAKRLLPHPLVRHHDVFRSAHNKPNWIRHANVPKSFNLDYIDVSPYENMPFRRLKYIDFDFDTTFKPKHKRVHKQTKRSRSDTKYDQLFDENGMLYLTQPLDAEDRKLNKLMNKVVEYSLINVKNNKFLRKPVAKVFNPDEVKRLKKIVRALDEESRSITGKTLRSEFDFSELVQ